MESKLSLPSVGALFKETWNFYQSHFKTLILISLLPVIITLLLGLISGVGFYASDSFSKDSIEFNIAAIALLSLFIIISIAAYILSALAMVYSIKDGSGVLASLRPAFRKFWPNLWLSILTTLIVLGGLALALIPGIIFSVWFVLGIYVMVAEDKGAFESILKSKEYVSGYFWPVLGRIVLLGVILAVLGTLSGIFGEEAANWINWIVQIFFTPFAAVYVYSLYRQFTVLKRQSARAPNSSQRGLFIFCAILGLLALSALIVFSEEIYEFFESLIKNPISYR